MWHGATCAPHLSLPATPPAPVVHQLTRHTHRHLLWFICVKMKGCPSYLQAPYSFPVPRIPSIEHSASSSPASRLQFHLQSTSLPQWPARNSFTKSAIGAISNTQDLVRGRGISCRRKRKLLISLVTQNTITSKLS